jgi:hypothetical protein
MRGTILITTALMALAVVPLASATELTRDEYVSRVNRNSNLANNTVLAFCKIDPARFG